MKISLFKKDWLYNDNEELCGINLGFDFCTEHESGINSIRKSFGIIENNLANSSLKETIGINMKDVGISARVVKKMPNNLSFIKKDAYCMMLHTDLLFIDANSIFDEGIQRLKWPGRKEDFVSYWSDNSFCFITSNSYNFDIINKAFINYDAAIYLGGSKMDLGYGLHLCIASKLDKNIKEAMIERDMSAIKLNDISKKTGIKEKLKKAKKNFFALTPEWKDESKNLYHFWLNPEDQNSNNYGWFTLEELELWIKGEGPIIKNK